MSAAELVQALTARGITLEPRGDRLHVRPVSRVSPDELARLRDLKPAVLALLTTRPDGLEVAHRADAFRRQLAEWIAAGRPAVPLLTLPDVSPRDGECCSCAAPLERPEHWRCGACQQAVHVALGVPT